MSKKTTLKPTKLEYTRVGVDLMTQVSILTASATAPETATAGDKYYKTGEGGGLCTYSTVWGAPATPSTGTCYTAADTQKRYEYINDTWTEIVSTAVMGLLDDFALAQASADKNEINAAFYDSLWGIIYTGKPIEVTFTLVNYDLADLPALFGGTYTAATATAQEKYKGASTAFASEHEWKITYQTGNAGFIIYKGSTMGVLKQDNKGALGYAVTITSLVLDGGTGDPADDKLYAILGDPATGA